MKSRIKTGLSISELFNMLDEISERKRELMVMLFSRYIAYKTYLYILSDLNVIDKWYRFYCTVELTSKTEFTLPVIV